MYLRILSSLVVNFNLTDLWSLNEAYVDIPYDEYGGLEVGGRALNLFIAIYNVKVLRIKDDTFRVICRVNEAWDFLDDLLEFLNVRLFDVISDFYAPYGNGLMMLIQKMPKLEILHLSKGSCHNYLSPRCDPVGETVPSCFISTLIRFRIKNFEGATEETELLEFVLRNALVLKCMRIHQAYVLFENFEALEELHEYIRIFPPVSRDCKIEFC